MQFLKFALVGCAAAVAHYGTLVILAELAHVPPVPASAAGFIAGGIVSYILNYEHVFQSDQSHTPTAGKFLAVALCGLGFNSALMYVLTALIGVHYLASQLTATMVVMVWSYSANRYWTFSRSGATGAKPALTRSVSRGGR